MLGPMKVTQPGPGEGSATSLEAEVWRLLGENRLQQAAAACARLTREHPGLGSVWHTASQLASRLNNPQAALVAIEKALAIDPQPTDWLLQKAMSLAKLGRIEDVAGIVASLAPRTMESAYQASALGMLLTQLGRREAAIEHYSTATRLEPTDARHYYNLACLQRSLGELEAAEANFDQAIRRNPADYESYKIRSELRQQTPQRNHVAELEQLLASGIEDARGRVQICYALAKELEDLGQYARSFRQLQAGSNLRRELMQYDIARDLDTMAAIRRAFPAALFARAATGNDSPEPIFILGMPRTGTTLVERILGSHSEVFSAGELNNFAMQLTAMLTASAVGRRTRDEMVEASAELDFAALGAAYLRSTRPYTGHTPRFIDKMPLNFLYIGLIRLALPNAKIVHLQRGAMDTCYAIYKQLFVDAYPFSYTLEELARYYVAYRQLMDHWYAVLPGVVHTVHYEALVADLETESRKLLDACGLAWQPQCLRFHENREASTTASTAQVRRPIYTSSVGKWRNYQQQLQPLAEILERAGYG